MKHVVVTGANGYIGAHVIEELLKFPQDFSVTAACRTNKCLSEEVQFVSFDIIQDAEDTQLYEKLGRPDICIHLAWRNGFQHNALSHIADFPKHFLFLKNLADHGTKHFAVAGSFREYGPVNGMVDESANVKPDNYYMLSKTMLKNALEIALDDSVCFQWLRPFTVYGDDQRSQSILSKIIQWEAEGKKTFPFTDGKEEYDYISVYDLAKQIVAIISQEEISGVIDCCSGVPMRLGDRVEAFIKEKGYQIRPEYGAFPSRRYDSPVIYGNRAKIDQIMKQCRLYQEKT